MSDDETVSSERFKTLETNYEVRRSQMASSQVADPQEQSHPPLRTTIEMAEQIAASGAEYAMAEDIFTALTQSLDRKIKALHFLNVREVPKTAYEFFAQEQARLTARELLVVSKSRTVTVVETRELIENLIALLDILLNEGERHAAKVLSDKIRDLIKDITPIMELLEPKSAVGVINWKELANTLLLDDAPTFVANFDLKMIDVKDRTLLGFGGMGVVFKVKFVGQPVAMKLTRNSVGGGDSIPRAAIAGALVRHPLIVRQIATLPLAICQLTLFEVIEGANLNLVAFRTTISDDVIKVLAAQICLAVQYLHKMGIVHRDIKPANVMVIPHGRIKLIDLDFAKICIGKFVPRRTIRTFENRVDCEFRDREKMGTKAFAAPETNNGKYYGRAIDWFSVGKTIHRVYTTCRPFFKDVPRDVTGHLQDFLEKLMQPDPSKRLTDIEKMRNHLFFQGVCWADCDNGRVVCDDLNEFVYPSKLQLNDYEEQEKLKLLNPERLVENKVKTSVFKVVSGGFITAVKQQGRPTLRLDDLFPTHDVRADFENVPSLLGNPIGLKNRLAARLEGRTTTTQWTELIN